MYRLISATPSPYARKVRISLIEKGIPFELQTEVPWDSTTSTPQFNPLEKLPVLILPDGGSVYESSYILEWLEIRHPAVRLIPAGVDELLLAKKFDVLCNGICDAIVLSFFESRRDSGGSVEWMARQRRKIEGGTRELSRLLADREWAVGAAFSLGDIALGTAVRYASVRYPQFDWRSLYPNLAVHSDKLERRESFRQTVPVAQTIRDKVV
jgi:glutathione S-transferase